MLSIESEETSKWFCDKQSTPRYLLCLTLWIVFEWFCVIISVKNWTRNKTRKLCILWMIEQLKAIQRKRTCTKPVVCINTYFLTFIRLSFCWEIFIQIAKRIPKSNKYKFHLVNATLHDIQTIHEMVNSRTQYAVSMVGFFKNLNDTQFELFVCILVNRLTGQRMNEKKSWYFLLLFLSQ